MVIIVREPPGPDRTRALRQRCWNAEVNRPDWAANRARHSGALAPIRRRAPAALR